MKLLRIVLLVFRMARVGNLFRMVTMHPVEPVAWFFFKPRNLMMDPVTIVRYPVDIYIYIYIITFERLLSRDNCK